MADNTAPQPASASSPKRTVKWRHNFPFEAREITKAQWKRAGVDNGRDVRWDSSNDWTVDGSALDFLSTEQFDKIIKGDNDFTVTEG